MKHVKVKLDIEESVTSVAQKNHRLPFHLRKKVYNALKRLLDRGITEPVNGTSEWMSLVIIAPKRN